MATSNALRRGRRRNARLLTENGLPAAPHHPKPRKVVRFSMNGRIERDSSTVERKRVPEQVGCTVTALDYMSSREKARLANQNKNNGRKIDRALIGDGTIAGFSKNVLPIETARKATMDADRRSRKAAR